LVDFYLACCSCIDDLCEGITGARVQVGCQPKNILLNDIPIGINTEFYSLFARPFANIS